MINSDITCHTLTGILKVFWLTSHRISNGPQSFLLPSCRYSKYVYQVPQDFYSYLRQNFSVDTLIFLQQQYVNYITRTYDGLQHSKSMEQSPIWEDNILLWGPQAHYRVNKSSPLNRTASETNQFHILTTYSFKSLFNILPFRPRSPKWFLSFELPTEILWPFFISSVRATTLEP